LEKSITNRNAAITVENIMGEGGIKVIPDILFGRSNESFVIKKKFF
jgi:Ornithine/acetylornithine aminotransferase